MNAPLVYDALKNAAQKWPTSPAVYDEYGVLTFDQLFSETEILKNKLLELGIASGMGIGVMSRNSRNFIIGIFSYR